MWKIINITLFKDVPILKMHSCGYAYGLAEMIESENESAQHSSGNSF